MKKIALILFSFFALTTYAQKISADNVPDVVKNAFKQKFPTAQKVKWELDYENYEAEFKMDKKEMSVKFDKDGNWIETETPIKPSAINAEVKEFLTKNFAGFVVKEAEKVETAAKGIVYELEVKKGEIEYELVVSEKGQLISRNELNKDKDKKAKAQ